MEEVILKKLECFGCGHKWLPRVEHKPRECPSCKRYNYDKEKEVKEVKEVKEAKNEEDGENGNGNGLL